MPYVIAASCVADYSCVEACPVDCIAPVPGDAEFDSTDQLYINPHLCIDCGSCVGACPVQAIFDSPDLPPQWVHYARVNREYFEEPRG